MKSLQMIVNTRINQFFLALLFVCAPLNVSAVPTFEVSPTMLNLSLFPGEMVFEQVSLTIHPLCIRAYEVDVTASDPAALMLNLSGIQVNGCGGDVSVFDIQFTGDVVPQQFDLNFVDSEFGGILGTIPVKISTIPIPAALPLFATGLLLLVGGAFRSRNRG